MARRHLSRCLLWTFLWLVGNVCFGQLYAATYETDITSGEIYRIVNCQFTDHSLFDEFSGNVPKAEEPTNVITALSHYWLITGDAANGYTVKNLVTGRYLKGVATNGGDVNNDKATISETEVACFFRASANAAGCYNILASADGTPSLNIHEVYNDIVGWQTQEDGTSGSEWRLIHADKDKLKLSADFRILNDNAGYYSLTEGENMLKNVYFDNIYAPEVYWKISFEKGKHCIKNSMTGRYVGSPVLGEVVPSHAEKTFVHIKANKHQSGQYNITPTDGSNVSLKIENGSIVGALPNEGGTNKTNSEWRFLTSSEESDKMNSQTTQLIAKTLEEGKNIVRLVSVNENGYVAYDSGEEGDYKVLMQGKNDCDIAQYWLVEKSGDNQYAFKNIKTGRYIQPTLDTNGNTIPLNYIYTGSGAKYFYVDRNPATDFPYLKISTKADHSNNSTFYYGVELDALIHWSAEDGGGAGFKFEAVLGEELERRFQNILTANHGLVRFVSGRNAANVATQSGKSSTVVSPKSAGLDYNQIWKIDKLEGGGYSIRSAATGQYVKLAKEENTALPLNFSGDRFYIKRVDDILGFVDYAYIGTNADFSGKTLWHDSNNKVVKWNNTADNHRPSTWRIEAAEDAVYADVEKNFSATDKARLLIKNNLIRIISDQENNYALTIKDDKLKMVPLDLADSTQMWYINYHEDYYSICNRMGTPPRYADRTEGELESLGITGEKLVHRIDISPKSTPEFPLYSIYHEKSSTLGWYYDGSEEGNIQIRSTADKTSGVSFRFVSVSNIQPTKPESGKYYRIYNDERQGLITLNETTGQLKCEQTSQSYSQYWELNSSDGINFTFRNVLTGQYVQKAAAQNNRYTSAYTPATFTLEINSESPYRTYHIVDANAEGFHATTTGGVIRYHFNNEKASDWYFEEVTLTDEQLEELAQQPHNLLRRILESNQGIVRLTSGRNSADVAEQIGETMQVTKKAEGIKYSQLWRIQPHENGGYTIRSMSKGQYVQVVGANSLAYPLGETGDVFYIKGSTIEGFGDHFFISSSQKFDAKSCFHDDGNGKVVRWDANSGASSWKILPVGDVTLEELEAGIEIEKQKNEVTNALPDILSHYNLVRIVTDRKGGKVITANKDAASHKITLSERDDADLSQVWIMASSGRQYYTFRNVATGRYIGSSSTTDTWLTGTTDANVKHFVNGAKGASTENPFFNIIHPATNDVCWHHRADDGALVTSTTEYTPGSAFFISAATDISIEQVQESLQKVLGWDKPKSGLYYRIVNKDGGTPLVENEEGDGKVIIKETEANNTIQYWQLVSEDNGETFKLKNHKSGKYLQANATTGAQYEVGNEGGASFSIRRNAEILEPWYNIVEAGNEGLNWERSSGLVKRNSLNADGARWRLEAVDVDVLTPPTTFYTIEDIIENHNGLMVFRSAKDVYTSKVITPQADGSLKMNTRSPELNEQSNWNQVWIVEKSGDTYSFRNLQSGNYIKNNRVSAEKGSFYIQTSANIAKAYNVANENKFGTGHNSLHLQDAGETIVLWAANSTPNSDWYFEPVTGISLEDIRNYYNQLNGFCVPESGKIYRIVNNIYGDLLTESFTNANLSGKANFDNATQYWRLTATEDGQGYNIQNISTRHYIQNNWIYSSDFQLGSTQGVFNIQEGGTYQAYYTIANKEAGHGLHQSASQAEHVVMWYTSVEASRWCFQEVTLSEEEIRTAEKTYDDYMAYNANISTTSENFLAFFSDASASELKDEYENMETAELRTAMASLPEGLQNIVLKVQSEDWADWEKEFRIAEYGAFSDAVYWRERLQTYAWGLLNNPTGIVADANEYVFIIVGNDIPEGATLRAEARVGYNVNEDPNQSIELKKGLNVFYCENQESHIFIQYKSANGTPIANWTKLNIHIEGGRVNGYFDIAKHDDDAWMSMRNAGLFRAQQIDLLGKYAQLRIETTGATQNGDKITPLVNVFDWFCHSELDIMGISEVPDSMKDVPGADEAYEALFPNYVNHRLLTIGDPSLGLYGSQFHIALGGNGCYKYDDLKNRDGSSWAAAHEYGHQNQGAIHLAASTEVSNNFFANVLVYRGGTSTSRGWSMQRMQEEMTDGTRNWPHIVSTDYWLPTQMYYALYLYYHAAGNDPLFYQKLFKLLRERPLNNPSGNKNGPNKDEGCYGSGDYLHFAKLACEAANEDLTDFFDYWGFFEPVENVKMASYQTWYMTTTQEMIDEAKEYMASFPKKCNPAMVFIEDRAVTSYCPDGVTPKKPFEIHTVEACETDFPGAQYSAYNGEISRPTNMVYTLDGETVTLASDAAGASGIKFHDAEGKLVYVAAKNEFTVPSSLLTQIDHSKTLAVLPDGTNLPLYRTDDSDVFKQKIYHNNGETSIRYTKGDDNAVLSAERDGVNAIATIDAENVPETLSSVNNIGVNGIWNKLVLTDKAGFGSPEITTEAKAKSISYSERKIWDGWNTACFPFAVKASDFGEGARIEVLSTEDSNSETLYFTRVEELAAGQPCLIYAPRVIENWNFEQTNENGVSFVAYPQVDRETAFYMNGSFMEEKIGAGHYKMNNAGDEFGMTSEQGMTYPFRAFVSPKAANAGAVLRIMHDGTLTGTDSPVSRIEGADCYDLQGRKVAEPKRGQIYIIGSKKVVFKK